MVRPRALSRTKTAGEAILLKGTNYATDCRINRRPGKPPNLTARSVIRDCHQVPVRVADVDRLDSANGTGTRPGAAQVRSMSVTPARGWGRGRARRRRRPAAPARAAAAARAERGYSVSG